MAIKFTIQGLLIYSALLLYIAAFAARVSRLRKAATTAYAGGFIMVVLSLVYRAWQSHHVPLANMFEVLLFAGMLAFPLSVFCRRFLRIDVGAGDMLIAAAVLFPAGFIFDAGPRHLPAALQSPLFVPHVAVYMAAYMIMAKAAVTAAAQLVKGNNTSNAHLVSREEATYRLVCLGFPFMTAGLVLGACWGKLAWGDYWNWDPKELWSLATWLLYVGYFHFRGMFAGRYARANATFALAGMVLILITLLWANLSSLFAGLHSYA